MWDLPFERFLNPTVRYRRIFTTYPSRGGAHTDKANFYLPEQIIESSIFYKKQSNNNDNSELLGKLTFKQTNNYFGLKLHSKLP